MKNIQKRTMVLPLISCLWLSALSQTEFKKLVFKEVADTFSKDYSVSKTLEILPNQFGNSPFVQQFKTATLKRCSAMFLVSKKYVKPNTRLGFTFFVYEYKSKIDATEKFAQLANVKQTHDESVFSKDWDYVFLYKNFIVRLDGGCLYSENAWNAIRQQAHGVSSLSDSKKNKNEIIECKCGGSCK